MHDASRRQLFALFSIPIVVGGLAVGLDAGQPPGVHTLQALVDSLKAQLRIDALVVATIVPSNPLLVSVQPMEGRPHSFQMAFEERFLTGLNEDDLTAIVAHELGHVWIFTHHPYLHTERLANSVAMRAVPRASLERVYSKVWEREGTKGDMVRFLGPQ